MRLSDLLNLSGGLQMVLYTVFILALFFGSVIVPLQIAASEFESERKRHDPHMKGWENTSIMQR